MSQEQYESLARYVKKLFEKHDIVLVTSGKPAPDPITLWANTASPIKGDGEVKVVRLKTRPPTANAQYEFAPFSIKDIIDGRNH